jgi:hypothetical protein
MGEKPMTHSNWLTTYESSKEDTGSQWAGCLRRFLLPRVISRKRIFRSCSDSHKIRKLTRTCPFQGNHRLVRMQFIHPMSHEQIHLVFDRGGTESVRLLVSPSSRFGVRLPASLSPEDADVLKVAAYSKEGGYFSFNHFLLWQMANNT